MQMVCYHVYVPLLLKLSNDVEENPGPRNINKIVDANKTVHADFNKSNQSMFGLNAGKQCVAMSLCSIVYNEIKSVDIWDKSVMNQILVYGNNLYSVISQSINKDFLLLTDVPELVDIDNDTFHLEYSESFSGALFMTLDNDPYVTLEHAFNEIFFASNYNCFLLTIGMNTVAIQKSIPDVFKFFYSHSRDLHGMQCTSGYSVLTSVEGVQNLVDFFHLTSGACQHFVVPFELKGVRCNKRTNLMSNQDSTDLMQSDFASRLIEQHNDKSTKIRDYKRAQRKNESPEQRERRLAKAREYKRLKLHSESLEERQSRLTKCREYVSAHRKNESSEQREKRLTNARQKKGII